MGRASLEHGGGANDVNASGERRTRDQPGGEEYTFEHELNRLRWCTARCMNSGL